MTSSLSLIDSRGVFNVSDHLPVYATTELKVSIVQQSLKLRSSFRRYNSIEFCSDLSCRRNKLDLINELDDVSHEVLMFDNLLGSTLEAHAPLVTIKMRNKSYKFMTNEVKDMMKRRD